MSLQASDFAANVERFAGFAALYDQYRPKPPTVLADVLAQLAQVDRPSLVVDLGCGTGLSTRFWSERAEQVLGVEPSEDMRRQAESQTVETNVSYRSGLSHSTGLPDGCADIVTCSQSFHWMGPDSTLAEAARILRRGGVFAAYDCDWPPTTSHWQAELAYGQLMERVSRLEKERCLVSDLKRWPKDQHLRRIRASGHFRFSKEIVLHHGEAGNAERLVGIALSQGGVETLLKAGVSEAEIGLDVLRAAAGILGNEPRPWHFSYRVRAGIV